MLKEEGIEGKLLELLGMMWERWSVVGRRSAEGGGGGDPPWLMLRFVSAETLTWGYGGKSLYAEHISGEL